MSMEKRQVFSMMEGVYCGRRHLGEPGESQEHE